jgi:iron(II)-dependent oxidoreductase
MRLVSLVWLSSLLSGTAVVAADSRPVVAVFDVQTKFIKLPKAKLDMLTDLLGQELGVGGVFQVMPPGDVKRALLEQSSASYKPCYDEKCQIALGRQLPANKLVTTTILKAAGQCRVAASLYDLRRQTTDVVARQTCACAEAGLVPAIEKVAGKLRDHQAGGARPPFVEGPIGTQPADDWEPETGQEAIVRFDSVPPGAVVLMDGNLVCQQTPCSKSVKLGLRRVSMQAPRYLKKDSQLKIAEGTKVAWTLEPNFGWIGVDSSPAGLEVQVNGQAVGPTPIARLEREPGGYEVLVVGPCHYDTGRKIQIERGKGLKLSIGMQEKQGAIQVSAKDAKGNDLAAELFVDGKPVGKTPGTYKVSVCARELEVRHAKLGSETRTLQIRERKVQSIGVAFRESPVVAEFMKADRLVRQFEQVALTGPPKTLQKNLTKKSELLRKADDALLAVFRLAVAAGDSEYAVASMVRLGQAYQAMAVAVREVPAPAGLTDEQRDLYRAELERSSAPVANKAAAAFRLAIEKAGVLSYQGRWSELAREQLQAMGRGLEPGEGEGPAPEWVYSAPAGIDLTRTEVTVAQYRACVGAGKCTQPRSKTDNKYCNWDQPDRDDHPVNCVDWDQATAFCEWAGGRLPAEDELEAEASNKGKRDTPWDGEKVDCGHAVWGGTGPEQRGCGRDSTWPVCSKPRGNSVSGLCDMLGNVWEWTSSWWDGEKKTHVVRGASFDSFDGADYCASPRSYSDPRWEYLVGFRCGRTPG